MPNKKPTHDNPQLSPEKIGYTPGIDTYLLPGNLINGLSLAPNERRAFFDKRPNLIPLLLREEDNPLVEEGHYQSAESRSREGEHYLTHEAITLIIEQKIRQHKTKYQGIKYNAKNIYVVKNDINNLEHILSNLNLNEREDAKIIYISGIHSVPFYLRNEQGKIKVFLVDSESTQFRHPTELISVIHNIFPGAHIFSSGATLQKDYYSCSTFAIKALMYFVKHGDEIFHYLEQLKTKKQHHQQSEFDVVFERDLMPTLLKMAQSKLELTEEKLNTIVSKKALLTLSEYKKRYAISADGKVFNSAALIKKYNYLETLNEKIKEYTIPVQGCFDLPIPLKRQHEKYHQLKQIRKNSRINPVTLYLDVISILETPFVETKNQDALIHIEKIKGKFPNFADHYKTIYGDHQGSGDTDRSLTEKLLFVAGYSEVNDLEHLPIYIGFVGKLLDLFKTYHNVKQYFNKHIQYHVKQPFHDLCLFNLPKESWNKKFWGELVLEHGMAATKFLSIAPYIDTLFTPQREKSEFKTFSDLELIQYLLENYKYKRSTENSELSSLCAKFHRSDKEFEEALAFVEEGLKYFDFLPEITIHGADLDKELERFTFKKLPSNDLQGLFLGEYTACCQSIHKQGEDCAKHGMTSPYSGFYVVYENKRIIAQSWVWIARDGSVVFDSWEYINKTQADIWKPFLLKAAVELIKYGFKRVLIGSGGNTPDLALEELDEPIKFLQENHYTDSKFQYILQTNLSEDILTRFEGFANALQFDYQMYSHLFSEDKKNNPAVFAKELTTLIVLKKLSFPVFLNLIKFSYIHRYEVFHEKNVTTHQLLLNAFFAYGDEMQQVLLLRNKEGEVALNNLVGFNSVGVMERVIKSIGKKDALSFGGKIFQYNALVHSAIMSDAVYILEYLFSLNKMASWDCFASLRVHKKSSALFCAVKYGAKRCLDLILYRMNDKATLISLLQEAENGQTILHYLARRDNVEWLKHIEKVCGHDEALRNTLEKKVSFATRKSPEISLNATEIAVFCNSKSVVWYLKNIWNCPVEHTCLSTAISENRLDSVVLLHELCEDENEWFSVLLKQYENPLVMAIRQNYFSIANYLVQTLRNLDNLHLILTTEAYIISPWWQPLESISEYAPGKEIDNLVRTILSLYLRHKDKLAPFFTRNRFQLFRIIAKKNNILLLSDVLDYFGDTPTLFEKMIFSCEKDTNKELSVLNELDVEFRDETNELTHYEFVNRLFLNGTNNQKKKLLLLMNCENASPKILNHLLTIVDSIDNGGFRRTWANFSLTGPLFTSFLNKEHADKISTVLFQYYQSLYGREYINGMLLKNWAEVASGVTKGKNAALLKYIYPSICYDNTKLEYLFELWLKKGDEYLDSVFDCFDHENIHSNSLVALEWVIDQNEIPDKLLINSLGIATRIKFNINVHSHTCFYLAVARVLFDACFKRCSPDKLQEIIGQAYWNLHINAISICEVSIRSCMEAVFNAKNIFVLLDFLIRYISEHYKNLFDFFNAVNKNGDTLFSFSCDRLNAKLVRLILMSLTDVDRVRIFEDYKKRPVKSHDKFILEIQAYIEALKKIEVLRLLKSEILKKIAPSESQILVSLLSSIIDKDLFYFDETNLVTFISSFQVDKVWQNVLNFFSARLSQQPEDIKSEHLFTVYYKHMQAVGLGNQEKSQDDTSKLRAISMR